MKKYVNFVKVTGIIAITLSLAACTFPQEVITASHTVTKISDDLYTMTYIGNYGFDEFLLRGGASTDSEVGDYLTNFITGQKTQVKPDNHGCSTVKGKSATGEELFGRNFDWNACTTMIYKTYPTNGYASISTCNLENLGFDDGYKPEGMINTMKAVAGIYVPMDGMNEKGLCVADLIIRTPEITNQNRGKPNLTTTTAIRLLLDKAATVDEAVALLEQYDMHSSADSMHHLSISDAKGNSAVIEYINDVMVVTATPVVTNFFLAEGDHYGTGSEQSKERYNTLKKAVANNKVSSEEQVLDALKSVSQTNIGEEYQITAWSCVYNQTKKTIRFYFRENWTQRFDFTF